MIGQDADMSAAPIRRQAARIRCQVRSCARSIPHRLPSLRPSPLPSTPSAAAPRGFVRALHRYYEARPTPRLFHGSFGSSPSCHGPGSLRATAGQTRSPRFRRVPFVRDGIFDHGRATAPRIPGPHMLPSTFPTGSASAIFLLSRLNNPPHTIAVYASRPPSPTTTQHSLPGARYGLPAPVFHRQDHASLPGARRGRDRDCSLPPAQIPACGFPAPGSCRRSGVIGQDADMSAAPIRRQAARIRCQVRSCARSIPHRLPSLRPSPLPSTPSAAAPRGFVRALHRYYEARPTPRLFHGSFGSSPSCHGPGSLRATAGQTRSPRFRRVPFVRDGIFDHGRATAPRIPGPHMLPSTFPTGSASAIFLLSRLNNPPHTIAVYASRPPSGTCQRQ